MSEKRLKLQATIEAKRISRLNIDMAYSKLDQLEEQLKKMKKDNDAKTKMTYVVEILKEELEKNNQWKKDYK